MRTSVPTLLFFCLLLAAPSGAQNRTPVPSSVPDSVLIVATGLASPTLPRARGNVTVGVLEETKTRLTLELRLSGLPSLLRKVTVVALDSANRPTPGVLPATANLTGSPEATLSDLNLTLAPTVAPGTLTTDRILVYGVSASGKTLGLLQAFTYSKSWLKTPPTLLATPLGEIPLQNAIAVELDPKKAAAIAKLTQMLATTKVDPGKAGKIQKELEFLKGGRTAAVSRDIDPVRSRSLPTTVQRSLTVRAPDEKMPEKASSKSQSLESALAQLDRYLGRFPPAERLGKLVALQERKNLPAIVAEAVRLRRAELEKPSAAGVLSFEEELNVAMKDASAPDRVRMAMAWFRTTRWPKKPGSDEEAKRYRAESLILRAWIDARRQEASQMKPVEAAKGVPEESKDLGAKGPGTARFELENVVEVNFRALSDRSQALSVAPFIFHDANAASGVYYYLPSRYVLDFKPDTGFGLKFYYDTASAADPVRITLDLKAAVNPDDLKIIEEIVKAACKSNNLPFQRLEPYRFSSVAFKLQDALAANLGIQQNKIFVQGYAENGTIRVVIGAMNSARDLFWSLLTRAGVSGAAVEYASAADPNTKIQVPVEIKLPDRNSFGILGLESGGLSRNATPFPVTLKFVHVLNFVNGKPWIFTFGLPDNELGAGSEVTIDRSQIPAWLDSGKLSKLWVEYQIVPTLDGLQSVETGATAQALSDSVSEFSLEKVGDWPDDVASVSASLTTKLFHPTGASEQTKELALGADKNSAKLGGVYLRGRQEGVDMGAANALVRYSLTVTYKSGATKKTPAIDSNYLTIPVGAEQISKAK